jgi:hypothetical protein
MTTFKPKDVDLRPFPPFCAALGRSECEFAAALIVLACQHRGSWGPVLPKEIGEALKADEEKYTVEGKRHPWANPFLNPDIDDLIARGFAKWIGEATEGSEEYHKRPVELTEACFDRLRTKGYIHEMLKIYVASSWRCDRQPDVVARLRAEGHEVYDFRNPAPGDTGFSWKQIHDRPPPWSAVETRDTLMHPVAQHGFDLDFNAMKWADS